MLADSKETKALLRGSEWIASDLQTDSTGNFMTGVLGFAQEDVLREFDDETFSWLKGPIRTEFGASERTMVPFAVDLREDNRWVAFATAQRIRPPGFAEGLKATLNNAVTNLKQLVPLEWDVDLVVEATSVTRWLEEHPHVTVFIREVYFSNPGKDLDEDRAEMRALAARVKQETFRAERASSLRLRGKEFEGKLEGIDTGEARIQLISVDKARFSSDVNAEATHINDYGDDLDAGVERVLEVLVNFAHRKAQERSGSSRETNEPPEER